MKSFVRMTLFASAVLILGGMAHANSNEDILRQKLTDQYNKTHAQTHAKTMDAWTWKRVATRLSTQAQAPEAVCNDVNKKVIAGTYVLTSNEQNKPCRIYDLSFPTLQTLLGSHAVSHIPIQSFGAGDYLNWMYGDYDAVLNKIASFKTHTPAPAELSSWVTGVRFLPQSVHALAATPRVAGTNLPVAFRASDLDIGTPFKFNAQDQQRLLAAFQVLNPNADATELAAWQAFALHPESILDSIHFNWNDVDKVYDIFIEGQFLPLRGPIALVDYNASYKLAVEGILRSVVHSALNQLVQFIPPPAQSLVSIALNDSFEFIDMAYEYQINKMEGTFNHVGPQIDSGLADRGMNILAAGRANFVQSYIMAVIQGQTFDWSQLETLGRNIRYDLRNSRDAEVSNINSSMVLDDGCSMLLTDDYFGICSKGKDKSMYSMISESTILFWNIGAPQIYNYNFHSEVLMKRSAAYLLSIGARLFDLPYVGFLLDQLTTVCKTYAYAGITDEAFLRSSLNLQKQTKALDADTQELSKWIYLQNINIFLPKTEGQENSVIQANANLLGISSTQMNSQTAVMH